MLHKSTITLTLTRNKAPTALHTQLQHLHMIGVHIIGVHVVQSGGRANSAVQPIVLVDSICSALIHLTMLMARACPSQNDRNLNMEWMKPTCTWWPMSQQCEVTATVGCRVRAGSGRMVHRFNKTTVIYSNDTM